MESRFQSPFGEDVHALLVVLVPGVDTLPVHCLVETCPPVRSLEPGRIAVAVELQREERLLAADSCYHPSLDLLENFVELDRYIPSFDYQGNEKPFQAVQVLLEK